MNIFIQSIPDRAENVSRMLEKVKATVHLDTVGTGCFRSFIDMLEYPQGKYRLHLQDDVILPSRLGEYLDKVIEPEMDKKRLHCLSLFMPQRKELHAFADSGARVIRFNKFLWMQAVVFSKDFVELCRCHAKLTRENKHDDVFVAEVLAKYSIPAYCHNPGIVQHDIGIKSAIGHQASVKRTSVRYDPDFIERVL